MRFYINHRHIKNPLLSIIYGYFQLDFTDKITYNSRGLKKQTPPIATNNQRCSLTTKA